MTSVSAYTDIKDTTNTSVLEFSQIYEVIKSSPDIRNMVLNYRKNHNSTFKMMLPCFTSCGVFAYRNCGSLSWYSEVICLDFDHISGERLKEIKSEICSWDITFMCFISPSGDGLKVLLRHDNKNPEYHNNLYAQVLECFRNFKDYGLYLDSCTSDLSRATFFSWDPEIYYNPDSRPFHFTPKEGYGLKNKSESRLKTPRPIETENMKRVWEIFNMTWKDKRVLEYINDKVWKNSPQDFTPGNRHNAVLRRAKLCFYLGINHTNALSRISYHYKKNTDFPLSEVEELVNYVYSDLPECDYGKDRKTWENKKNENINKWYYNGKQY